MKKKLPFILNVIIVFLVAVGLVILFMTKVSATGLSADGFDNFKFYTVLSNTFAGIIALIQLVIWPRGGRYLKILKLTAASSVAVTFLVIACFLGPLYGMSKMYKGSNLFFHLIVPLVCVVEFTVAAYGPDITIRDCFLSTIFTIIYGAAYLTNIFFNGTGEWPKSNDWYGFLNWGWGVGFLIYAAIWLLSLGVACLLRLLAVRLRKKSDSERV